MAVEDFGGSMFGKPIEIVYADHQNKADVGSAIAREWFSIGQVDMVIDMPNSGSALAVQQVGRDGGADDPETDQRISSATGCCASWKRVSRRSARYEAPSSRPTSLTQ